MCDSITKWGKYILIGGFTFFLIKGLFWIVLFFIAGFSLINFPSSYKYLDIINFHLKISELKCRGRNRHHIRRILQFYQMSKMTQTSQVTNLWICWSGDQPVWKGCMTSEFFFSKFLGIVLRWNKKFGIVLWWKNIYGWNLESTSSLLLSISCNHLKPIIWKCLNPFTESIVISIS